MKRVYIDDKGRLFEDEVADLIMELDDEGFRIMKVRDSKNEKSRGGNIMTSLFKKTGKTKVVEIDKRDGTIKRKAKVLKDIAVMSIKGTFSDPLTYAAAGSVGLQSGLKYKGDAKHGSKAGLATAAVLAGINVAGNIVANMDVIKEA